MLLREKGSSPHNPFAEDCSQNVPSELLAGETCKVCTGDRARERALGMSFTKMFRELGS